MSLLTRDDASQVSVANKEKWRRTVDGCGHLDASLELDRW